MQFLKKISAAFKAKPRINSQELLQSIIAPSSPYGIDGELRQSLGISNVEFLTEFDDIGWVHVWEDYAYYMKADKDWRNKAEPVELLHIKVRKSPSGEMIWGKAPINTPPSIRSQQANIDYLDKITSNCESLILARFEKRLGVIGHNGTVKDGKEEISEITVIRF